MIKIAELGPWIMLIALGVILYAVSGPIGKDYDLPLTGTLVCNIDGLYKEIPNDKIVSYEEEVGYWVFTNGYAKNCYIHDK